MTLIGTQQVPFKFLRINLKSRGDDSFYGVTEYDQSNARPSTITVNVHCAESDLDFLSCLLHELAHAMTEYSSESHCDKWRMINALLVALINANLHDIYVLHSQVQEMCVNEEGVGIIDRFEHQDILIL